MKRVALLIFLAGWLVPVASAQEHFQVGAYADYFRISQTNTNMAGLGGRAAIKALSSVMLEGEMSYDFEQAFPDGQGRFYQFPSRSPEPVVRNVHKFCQQPARE